MGNGPQGLLTARDFSGHLPWRWMLQWCVPWWHVRLEWDAIKQAWCRYTPVVGRYEVDGWFYPVPGQLIKYRIKY